MCLTIQRNFISNIYAPNLNNPDYWDRLRHFKLYSLQRRRERYAIIYTWKVIHNIYPNPGIHFNHTTEDHRQHPNQGIQVNIHQRNDLTVHHISPMPEWLKEKSILENYCDLYNCHPLELRLSLDHSTQPEDN